MICDLNRNNEGLPKSYREGVGFMFSHWGPRLLLAFMLSLVLARAVIGEIGFIDCMVIAVFFLFRGFMEWLLHMYIFNASPLPIIGWRLRNPISAMHRVHHCNPKDAESLFFGWKGVFFVLFFSHFFLLILFQNFSLSISGMIAVSINLLFYEWFHLVAHSNIEPSWPPFKRAILNHRRHHFVDGQKSMGVTSILADKLFGTYY
ncbi:sterol desaturase family protein [Alcanivorax jadensis]|uniref:sterol desaturase family protein n=1 Tax=Alcanivorax jadensis TaxID=64988 RepID=UPI002409E1F2|nr:sterol desaturase family protein [Alcanivorax jadensis]MDF1637855.1 sterol desaturase family protein [Alcanivorax jadensis]